VHEVEIGAGTVDARVAQVTLIAGKKTTITAEVLPPTKVEPPTLPRQVAPRPRSFPSAWLVGGAAVSLAAMALPLAFAVDAKNKRDAADTLGAGSTGYPDAVDRFNDARTRYALSWAVPGALALATAAVVLVKILSEPPKTEHAWDRSWARVAF
jgi:hypothetical protein